MFNKQLCITSYDLAVTLLAKGFSGEYVMQNYENDELIFWFADSKNLRLEIIKIKNKKSWITKKKFCDEAFELREYLGNKALTDYHWLNQKIN